MNFLQKIIAKSHAKQQLKLAVQEVNKNNLENALKLCNRALEKFENYNDAYFSRGVILCNLQKWDKALDDLKRLISLKPTPVLFNFYIGICEIGCGNLQEGINYLDRQLELTPNENPPHWHKAMAYFRLENYPEALSSIETAIIKEPTSYNYELLKSEILFEMKDYDNAILTVNKAIEIENYPGESLFKKFEFLEELNRHEEAIESISKLILEHSTDGDLHLRRGKIYKIVNKLDLALIDFEKAVKYGVKDAKEEIKNIT